MSRLGVLDPLALSAGRAGEGLGRTGQIGTAGLFQGLAQTPELLYRPLSQIARDRLQTQMFVAELKAKQRAQQQALAAQAMSQMGNALLSMYDIKQQGQQAGLDRASREKIAGMRMEDNARPVTGDQLHAQYMATLMQTPDDQPLPPDVQRWADESMAKSGAKTRAEFRQQIYANEWPGRTAGERDKTGDLVETTDLLVSELNKAYIEDRIADEAGRNRLKNHAAKFWPDLPDQQKDSMRTSMRQFGGDPKELESAATSRPPRKPGLLERLFSPEETPLPYLQAPGYSQPTASSTPYGTELNYTMNPGTLGPTSRDKLFNPPLPIMPGQSLIPPSAQPTGRLAPGLLEYLDLILRQSQR